MDDQYLGLYRPILGNRRAWGTHDAYKILIGNPERNKALDLGMAGKIGLMVNWILYEWDVMMYTGFIWPRMAPLRVWFVFRLAEKLLDSEGLSSMELIMSLDLVFIFLAYYENVPSSIPIVGTNLRLKKAVLTSNT
jgi:hypothetical protein